MLQPCWLWSHIRSRGDCFSRVALTRAWQVRQMSLFLTGLALIGQRRMMHGVEAGDEQQHQRLYMCAPASRKCIYSPTPTRINVSSTR